MSSSDAEDEWFGKNGGLLPWWGKLAKNVLQLNEIPKHVAFVMDGNRRYARLNRLASVIEGHSCGFAQMIKVLDWCHELGVKEVTVYAFSIENFKRDESEVTGLMKLAEEKFNRLLEEKDRLAEKQICFRFFGDLSLLPLHLQKLIAQVEELTKDFRKSVLNVCLAYTSQNEIARAMRSIQRGICANMLREDDINEALINKCLDTRNSLSVDMLIRTSGERRLSDFLLLQCSKSYIHFEDVLWPDMSFWHLFKSILSYQRSRHLSDKVNLAIRSNVGNWSGGDESDDCNESYSEEKRIRLERFLSWMDEERLNERFAKLRT